MSTHLEKAKEAEAETVAGREVDYETRKVVRRDKIHSRVSDITALYVREMRAVAPLLDRKQEAAIGKQIESGKNLILKAISRAPITARYLAACGRKLRAGTINIKDLVRFNQEKTSEEELERKIKDTLVKIDVCVQAINGNINSSTQGGFGFKRLSYTQTVQHSGRSE